ncbi:MAG: hypothetical protein ACFE89_01705 [Candidatus Hodarchaeota archaeon]
MGYNKNKAKRRSQLPSTPLKEKETISPRELVPNSEKTVTEPQESDLSADQLAIIFVCQRGHQSLISILQGVNSTRVPVGKPPLKEEKLRDLLKDLENQGYLSTTEIHDQTTWIATAKANALET